MREESNSSDSSIPAPACPFPPQPQRVGRRPAQSPPGRIAGPPQSRSQAPSGPETAAGSPYPAAPPWCAFFQRFGFALSCRFAPSPCRRATPQTPPAEMLQPMYRLPRGGGASASGPPQLSTLLTRGHTHSGVNAARVASILSEATMVLLIFWGRAQVVRAYRGLRSAETQTESRGASQARDCLSSGQVPTGAWSHLIALRQGAFSLLLIGVCNHTATLCRAMAQRLGPIWIGSGRGAGGNSCGVSQ